MVVRAAPSPFGVRLAAVGLTDVGKRRERNEDAVLVRPELGLYVVADGAGGHASGKIASALAVTSIGNFFGATDLAARKKPSLDAYGIRNCARRLAIAIQKANKDVVEISRSTPDHKGMGSTVVAVVVDFEEPLIHLAWVGDSRCYRVRAGSIDQLSHDHSLMNDVLSLKPDMPEAALAKLPGKVVTRALGMEAQVRVSVRTFEVARGDRFLICSDGLHGEVPDAAILDGLMVHDDPHAAAKHLIEMANLAGGRDNIAALVLHAEPAEDAVKPNTRASGIFDGVEVSAADAAAFLGLEVVTGVDPSGNPITSRLGAADQRVLAALAAAEANAGAASKDRICKVCGAKMQAGRFCPQCGAV